MISNGVIDMLRQSFRRRFPVGKDEAFHELLESLAHVSCRPGSLREPNGEFHKLSLTSMTPNVLNGSAAKARAAPWPGQGR